MRCGREVRREGCAWKTCVVYNRSPASAWMRLHVERIAEKVGAGVGSLVVVVKSDSFVGVLAQRSSS